MKSKSVRSFTMFLGATALMLGLGSSPVHALLLGPGNMIEGIGYGPSNCEPGCVYDVFGLPDDGSLNLLYKADVGDQNNPATTEEGIFANSYGTTFSATALDPQNALIEYDGTPDQSIICPDCFLAVKDGNHDPGYYFYNLSAWNGTEDLDLRGFWPNGGAISHVSIWGRPGDDTAGGGTTGTTPTPEPGTMFLLGSGLAGLGFWRWKTKK